MVLNNLAMLLRGTNRLDEADEFYRRALAINEKIYGSEHPDVAITVNNLGALRQEGNRLGDAEAFHRRPTPESLHVQTTSPLVH